MIMGADCVPLLFYDPVQQVIGAAHAGWRGTVQKIAIETIKAMQEAFKCLPSDILVGIGPSIGPSNYEVDNVVYQEFINYFENGKAYFTKGKTTGKYYLDLWKTNKMQLLSTGVKEENIELSGICTFENNSEFFSSRRGDSGRFAAGIMLS